MRILIITNLYPDARLPAFGTFVAGHAEALRRAGAEVEVVATTGIPVHTKVLRKYASLSFRTLLAALRSRMRRRRPQVVEAHVAYPTAVPAWIAARILGARLVVYSHGSDVTVPGRGFHQRLARRMFRAADLHVATSRFIAGELVRRFGVDRGRVIVLSPGIDFARFSARGSPGERTGILFVGRLARGKGVHELVQALASLDAPPALRFVGDGPDRDVLERAANAHGIQVAIDGALPPSDVAHAMQAAAVLAVPSTHPEGLGLVALEGMAAGALVVGTDIGGLPESIVDGETGWLVPAGDVDALASALADALTVAAAPSARRERILDRARAAAKGHDVDAIATRTLAAYDALVGGYRDNERPIAGSAEDPAPR